MAEVDTSSYPKPAALPVQKSLLDTVGQFQQLESNNLSINQQKLNQTNQALGYMTRAMGSLGPDASKEQYLAVGQNAVKMGLVPGNMLHIFEDRLKAAASPQAFYDEFMNTAADHQQQLDYHLGPQGTLNNGNSIIPIRTPQKPGGTIQSTGLPIATQPGPNQVEFDPNNQPRYRGVQSPTTAPGMVTAPPPAAGVRLPIAPANPSVNNNQGTSTQSPNQIVQDRGFGGGAAAGPVPGAEEGLKLRTQDQAEAGTRMMAAKPAIQALPLMQTKGFLSGPGTEGFTKAVSALKAWGLVDTADENDPTAIRQEVNKKLAQYVSSSPVGQRSDAAQALKEAGSPSAKVQILPALVKLTKDAIALDRVQSAMPNAFKSKDYSQYGQHRATFPQSIDEKAFTLDLEPEEKSKAYVDGMAKKLQSTNKREAGQAEKFFKSLRIAKEQGFYQ